MKAKNKNLMTLEKFKEKNNALLDDFLNVFEDAVHKAKKKLGTLFNKDDYPSKDELKRKFDLYYSFAPIADETDLRIKLEKEEVAAIKKNIEDGMQVKIREAHKSIVDRMIKVTQAIHDKMKDKESTFRDSLIDNAKAVREMIPVLNFDNDETINEFNNKLKKICVKPVKIRTNVQVRKDVEKESKKLLKKLNEYINL
jgi:TRAP-type mannitol/chloroaromatic compound transport system substrate-binding protein